MHVTIRGGVLGGVPKNIDKTPPLFFLLCEDGPRFLADDDDMVDSATKDVLDVGIVVWRLCTLAGRTTAALCGEVDPKIASKPGCLCRFLCPIDLVLLGAMDAISASMLALGATYCSSAQSCGMGADWQTSSKHSSASSPEELVSLSVSLSTGVPCSHVSFSSDSLLCLRLTLWWEDGRVVTTASAIWLGR